MTNYTNNSGKTGYKKHRSILKRNVVQYSYNGRMLAMFTSLVNAHTSTGIHSSSILNCCRKRSKTAGGCKWSFAPQEKRLYIKENFVKILGYDDYSININGDIYNNKCKRFIKNKNIEGSNTKIILKYDNEPFLLDVDHLVAHQFIQRTLSAYINIYHIDGNLHNNHISNLLWV